MINVLNMSEEGKLNYKQQRAKIDANYSILVSFDMNQNKEILLGDKKIKSGDSLICYYSLNNPVTDARYSGQLSESCSLVA